MLPVSIHFRYFPHIPPGWHSQVKHDDDADIKTHYEYRKAVYG
jgi:hypothetical protein